MRDQIIPFTISRYVGSTVVHRAEDIDMSELDRELLVASTCSDVAAFLSTVNTSTFSVGVKFFWTGLKAGSSQILCHARLSSKDSKFQKVMYHIWVVNITQHDNESEEDVIKEKGESADDQKSATVPC